MRLPLASDIMRITINIATPILEELKRIQRKEGGTLGELVARLLAERLQTRPADLTDSGFDRVSRSMRARVDLTDKEAVYAIMDGAS